MDRPESHRHLYETHSYTTYSYPVTHQDYHAYTPGPPDSGLNETNQKNAIFGLLDLQEKEDAENNEEEQKPKP